MASAPNAFLRRRLFVFFFLGNALKFTPPQGCISLTAQPVTDLNTLQSQVAFMVEDTGIGISASQLADIFGRFTQVEEDHNCRYGGTGLGQGYS